MLVDEVHDHLEGLAGVGDVVDDEDALPSIAERPERGQQHGLVEGFTDTRVDSTFMVPIALTSIA